MDTVLKTITHFLAVPVGVPTTLAHGLLQSGTGVVPDSIQFSIPGFTATATSVNVIVTNNRDAAANVDVLCEHWHSMERQILTDPLTDQVGAVKQPFITSGGLAGSASVPNPYTPTDGTWNVTGGVSVSSSLQTSGRQLMIQGADVASAANVVLGSDGNLFEITGAVAIELISNLGWQEGSVVVLQFTANPVVHNGHATVGTDVTLLLAGGDFNTSANDTLTLMLCEIGGVQAWREIGRTVI